MKYFFTLLLICTSGYAFAVRFHTTYQRGLVMNKKNNTVNSYSLFTERINANGVGLQVSLPVYKKFHLGLHCNIMSWGIDDGKVQQFVSEKYQDTNYYISQHGHIRHVNNFYVGLDASYLIQLKHFDVEPFAAFGIVSVEYQEQKIHVDRKRKYENYSETNAVSPSSKGFPYYGQGFKLHRKVFKNIYLQTGIAYYSTTVTHDIVEEKNDYTGEIHEVQRTKFKSPYQNMQLEIGLHVRVGKRYNK